MDPKRKKYTSKEYLLDNPTWHIEDSPWKASVVVEVLQASNLTPASICEVGCGAGGILAELRRSYPQAGLFGYDIAPEAAHFWPKYEQANIHFQLGDFFALNNRNYDVILLLDVIEHLADPATFLSDLRGIAEYYVLHIPLDLSAINVLREKPIIQLRKSAGHIHYFTKNLALSLLRECGYEIIQCHYTGVSTINMPRSRYTWKGIAAYIPRRAAFFLNKEVGVRALGGETLIVLGR